MISSAISDIPEGKCTLLFSTSTVYVCLYASDIDEIGPIPAIDVYLIHFILIWCNLPVPLFSDKPLFTTAHTKREQGYIRDIAEKHIDTCTTCMIKFGIVHVVYSAFKVPWNHIVKNCQLPKASFHHLAKFVEFGKYFEIYHAISNVLSRGY